MVRWFGGVGSMINTECDRVRGNVYSYGYGRRWSWEFGPGYLGRTELHATYELYGIETAVGP